MDAWKHFFEKHVFVEVVGITAQVESGHVEGNVLLCVEARRMHYR
jgi:hypothetical protein